MDTDSGLKWPSRPHLVGIPKFIAVKKKRSGLFPLSEWTEKSHKRN